MSWEIDSKSIYKCPCGDGEYEVKLYSDDWNRSKSEYKMLCPKCEKEYFYDYTEDQKGRTIGWVNINKAKEEINHKKDLLEKAKKLYFNRWKSEFNELKNKKDIWNKLTKKGTYNPYSLQRFYKDNKNKTIDEIILEIQTYFTYDELKRVFDVCNIFPDWNKLGASISDIYKLSHRNPELECLNLKKNKV